MGYKTPLLKTEYALVSEHNRLDIAPDHCFAVQYSKAPEITAWEFFQTGNASEVRGLFDSLVHGSLIEPADGRGSFIMFHASPWNQDVENMTNSKLSHLHFHVISGALGEGYRHIETEKTYVPQPNSRALRSFFENVEPYKAFQVVSLLPEKVREAKKHSLLFHPGFANVSDFVINASDDQVNALSGLLQRAMHPYLQENGGGVRMIIDERYSSAGMLAVHLLGGEYLGQEPDKTHRWFDKPVP